MPIIWFERYLIYRWYREVLSWEDSRSSQTTRNSEVECRLATSGVGVEKVGVLLGLLEPASGLGATSPSGLAAIGWQAWVIVSAGSGAGLAV
jgi:hypothetical protein